MASRKTIAEIIAIISSAYPRFSVDQSTVDVWISFVADIPDDLLKASVCRFISSADHPFPPSIPEIRAQATDIRREVVGVPTAFEAWEEVINMPAPRTTRLMRDGVWVEPEDAVWKNEVVGIVAARLGWPKRFPTGSDEMADRAHFVKAYESEVRKRLQTETQVPLVTKYIEQEKSKRLLDVTGEMKKLTEARKA